MPEGPSIVILKEEVASFSKKKVTGIAGNTRVEKEQLLNKKISDFKSWGKHFLICFPKFYVRIHFMLFGSYRINEIREGRQPRLSLQFKIGEINFYACSVKIFEGSPNDTYNWETDVMSDQWNPKLALKQLRDNPDRMVCDVLMDQSIFSGVGNIIKNEVLYRIKVHPESRVSALPATKLRSLVKEARKYCFQFYEWKKQYVLKKHWKIYRSRLCRRCNLKPVIKLTGMGARKSFFCTNCQELYK